MDDYKTDPGAVRKSEIDEDGAAAEVRTAAAEQNNENNPIQLLNDLSATSIVF